MSSHIQPLLVAGVAAIGALYYRHRTIRQLRSDHEKLAWLQQNADKVRPSATYAEKVALHNEIKEQERALKSLWPLSRRVEWEDLPMDESYTEHFYPRP